MKLKTSFTIFYYALLLVAVISIVGVNLLKRGDQYQYYSAPELSTQVSEIQPKSALLTGNVQGSTDCARGFIVSKTSTVTFENPDIVIIRCGDGSGTFHSSARLQHYTVYCVASFAWYPGHPDQVGYGNTVVFKTR